ncbi:MAG: ketoacyl-ACP synthase III [Saprospiraceae bacterium]|nr:ketoacyl-ACP synthase III [Saprospiraceae bacterium]
MTNNAVILSTGSYAPERVVENAYFNALLGEDVDTWLRENVQIYRRRWCADDESTADLAQKAAQNALDAAGLKPEDIDLLIVATDTPEYISPSTASVVQDRMGLTRAGTFDLNTACAGFVTALDVASRYIRSDTDYQTILVVGAYAMSKYLNMTDKKTVTLFADGAGAVVLGARPASEGTGFNASLLRTQGQYNSWMGIYAGGAHQPVDAGVLERREHQLQFVRRFPKELNPEIWTEMALELCHKKGISPNDVDHYFLTQININSIHETMDRLGVDRARAATIMHDYGYTGSACIPMALDQWNRAGKIKAGDKIIFIGSGGGLAFGAALFTM